MSIEESHIMLSQDGELFTPTNYIYIQPHTNRDGEREYELKIDAGLGDLLNWKLLKKNPLIYLTKICMSFVMILI